MLFRSRPKVENERKEIGIVEEPAVATGPNQRAVPAKDSSAKRQSKDVRNEPFRSSRYALDDVVLARGLRVVILLARGTVGCTENDGKSYGDGDNAKLPDCVAAEVLSLRAAKRWSAARA